MSKPYQVYVLENEVGKHYIGLSQESTFLVSGNREVLPSLRFGKRRRRRGAFEGGLREVAPSITFLARFKLTIMLLKLD